MTPIDDIAPSSFRLAARLVRFLTRIYLAVAGSLFLASTVALAVDVGLRYGFSDPIDKLSETVTIAFTFVFLLGGAALYARNEDIVLEIVYTRLPRQAGRYLVLAVYAATVITAAVVLYQTLRLIGIQWHVPTPVLRVPLSIFGIPLAIAAASIVFTSLVECWASVLWITKGVRPAVWPKTGGTDDLRETC